MHISQDGVEITERLMEVFRQPSKLRWQDSCQSDVKKTLWCQIPVWRLGTQWKGHCIQDWAAETMPPIHSV